MDIFGNIMFHMFRTISTICIIIGDIIIFITS